MSPENTHKLMGFYMEVLIVGYRVHCYYTGLRLQVACAHRIAKYPPYCIASTVNMYYKLMVYYKLTHSGGTKDEVRYVGARVSVNVCTVSHFPVHFYDVPAL